MALNAAKAAGGTGPKAEPLAPDNYMARVAMVIDLGVQKQRPYQGKDKDPAQELLLTYELVTEFMKDEDGNDDPEKPRWISEYFPLFNLKAERAKSTKRYLALDPKQQYGGDFSALAGAACLVAVVNNERDGRVYNNVGNISPPLKGIPVPENVKDPIVFDFDEPDPEAWEAMPDWVNEKIKQALNYEGSKVQAMVEGGEQPTSATEYGDEDETNDIPDDDFPMS